MIHSRVLSLLLLAAFPAAAQRTAEESMASMFVAEGYELSLFAAEPELVNPTSIDVDAQGRVWVTEAVNYRIFKHVTARPEGDRIRVLEDTDGDGRCDKATTFYQDPSLQAPMGIAVLGDRVYVCQSPDLFYLEDTDGDGAADKKTVILTGFGGVDHDHAIHGVQFGADGYLYMTVGDAGMDVTDKSGNRIVAAKTPEAPYKAAVVLRCDLEGNRLELLADGMRNPYEPTVDSAGNVYVSDNDDDGNEQTRVNYVMEGGHYGYYPRPRGDRRLDEVHWSSDQPGVVPTMIKTGFGSPCGMIAYEGDLMPSLRGTLIHAEAGPRVIRSYRPIADGAGYRAHLEILVANEGDSWFRPVDVAAAPDGSIMIADWTDPGVGGHNMGDISRGRIYRLAPRMHRWRVPPLDLESDAGLAAAFGSPNQARRYLGYRGMEARVAQGESRLLTGIHRRGFQGHNTRARAMWLLARDGENGRRLLEAALTSDIPEERIQAVRILGRERPEWLREFRSVIDEGDAPLRRQALTELARYRDEEWARAWATDLALAFDGSDRFYREAAGIALKGHEAEAFAAVDDAHPEWNEIKAGLAIQLHPEAARAAAEDAAKSRRTAPDLHMAALKALDAIGGEASGKVIVAHAAGDDDPAVRTYALHLLARDEGGVWESVLGDPKLEASLEKALADEALAGAALRFVSDTRRVSFYPMLLSRSQDPDTPAAFRSACLQAVQTLVAARRDAVGETPVATLQALVSDPDPDIAIEAVAATAAFGDEASRELLHSAMVDPARPQSVRQSVANTLARTKSGALLILRSVEARELPEDIRLGVAELLHSHREEDIRLMAEQLMPRDATMTGEPLPPLNELLAMTGDPERGKMVFFSADRAQCARCHMVGSEGKEVGPTLTKIGEKFGKEGLYESILNPNAAISHEYEVWIVETDDFEFVNGYIRAETEEYLEMMDAAGVLQRIDKAKITERTKSATSLMPTGLSAGMTAQDLADLVAYLETLK